ncbi:hypothetical protein PsYK624_139350 [Phanerochaete sordida]|uniref:Uncharacterized protein n=1 Tax=Phanerochaete sordida TaxID=48140 RepID=A0A9P3GQQ5_9APHY|nr:hypothetical protein PsYK624_139350 [Phanerochaete sordida]
MPTYIFDDYYGDERLKGDTVPTYLPAVNQWDPVGGTCAGCTSSTNLPTPIDPLKAQNATWHSVTVSPDEPTTTITMNFTGTAVTAYCILPPDLGPYITSYMNVSFILDGKTVGTFERSASGTDWTYNYPVHSESNLENKQHTFVVQPRADVDTSYLVFDYFTYEFDGDPPLSSSSSAPTSTPASSGSAAAPAQTSNNASPQHSSSQASSTPVGAIAGGVIGGVIFLIAVLLALWFFLRRRARQRRWPEADAPKEAIDEVPYPQTTPFLAMAPQTLGRTDHTGSRQSLVDNSEFNPYGGTSTSDQSSTLLSSSANWPRSAEGKRALADASMQRVAEMEARVAQGPAADAESGALRREIDALQAQVGQLHAALEQQAAEIREGALYGLAEAPPSYEEEETRNLR